MSKSFSLTLPLALLNSLETVPGFDRKAFEEVHNSGEQVTSIRINPAKFNPLQLPTPDSRLPTPDPRLPIPDSRLLTPDSQKVPWSSFGYYLPSRPAFTLDPLLHAGVYYVQEASSMFLEQALKQTVDLSAPLKVLDLCAAPGGKSTLILSLISEDSLLVSNEVIRSRASIIQENLTKWGAANVIISNNDAKDFVRLENFFDVIVIDAPCSGSGLFRRDPGAITEWSEGNVMLCCQRQRRIVADVYLALKKKGILIYSTCSYSKEEDEEIADWLVEEFNIESLKLSAESGESVEKRWNITESVSPKNEAICYRFYPDKVKGEGLFIACFMKNDGESKSAVSSKKGKTEKLTKDEERLARSWLNGGGRVDLYKQNDFIFAFPARLKEELSIAMDNLYIRQAGITIGKIMHKELVPDHALALSHLLNNEIVSIALNKQQALQYLRKENVTSITADQGWAVVEYEGVKLGWIKVLPNRVNNYYPKEWRILKVGNN